MAFLPLDNQNGKEEYLYSAISYACIVSKSSDMITQFKLQITPVTMPAFPS